jgi:insulysin
MSTAAVNAFEELLGRPELNGTWKQELDADTAPLVSDFEKYWREQGIQPEVMVALPELVKKYPLEDGASLRKDNVTFIQDVKGFKETLQVSEEARPLVEWGDLPISKF